MVLQVPTRLVLWLATLAYDWGPLRFVEELTWTKLLLHVLLIFLGERKNLMLLLLLVLEFWIAIYITPLPTLHYNVRQAK